VRLFDGDYDYYLFKREQEEKATGVSSSVTPARTLSQATRGASHATSAAAAPGTKPSGAERGTPRRVHASGGPVAAPMSAGDVAGPKTKEQKRAEAEARNRAYRSTKERKERLKSLDAELETAQARHAQLIELMASPELYADPAAFDSAIAEYNALKAQLPRLEEEWIAVTEEIERLSSNED
jgi:ATP-binding cassette, subfamily F, member 3